MKNLRLKIVVLVLVATTTFVAFDQVSEVQAKRVVSVVRQGDITTTYYEQSRVLGMDLDTAKQVCRGLRYSSQAFWNLGVSSAAILGGADPLTARTIGGLAGATVGKWYDSIDRTGVCQ